MSNRKSIPVEWKQKLGKQCWNCGSTEDIQYHHIVPLIEGGNDILSNMCCLCGICHSKIHKLNYKGNHNESIKKGIEKAKAKGIHCGKLPADYESIMSSIAKNLTVFENGELTEKEIEKLNNIKPTTFHKVKKMLYEELEKEEWNHSFPRPNRILKTPLYEYQILEAREKGISIKTIKEKRINK